MVDFHNIIVAASNIFYIFLSTWLLKNSQYLESLLLLVVAVASTIFHVDPENHNNKFVDILIANVAILTTFLMYYPKWEKKGSEINISIVAGILSAIIGVLLFIYSGDDYDSMEYIVMHSFWHVLTALAAYLFIKESL